MNKTLPPPQDDFYDWLLELDYELLPKAILDLIYTFYYFHILKDLPVQIAYSYFVRYPLGIRPPQNPYPSPFESNLATPPPDEAKRLQNIADIAAKGPITGDDIRALKKALDKC